MKKLKFFGFKSIVINGHLIHSCNIAIDRLDEHQEPVIDGVTVCRSQKLLKSGREKLTTTFSYLTTDIFEHTRMLNDIGLFLKEHAENKLKKKYSWVHKNESLTVPDC